MTSIKNAFADGASIMRESIQRAKQFDKLGEDEFIKVKAKLMCASFNVVLFAALLAAFAILSIFQIDSFNAAQQSLQNIESSTWPILLVTVISIFLAVIALLTIFAAKCESAKILLLLYILFFLCATVLLIGSGICLLLKDYIDAELQASSEAQIVAEQEESSAEGFFKVDIALAMVITGVAGILLFLLILYIMSKMDALLTRKRTMSLLIQVITIILFPVASVAFALSIFIVESAVLSSAMVTALVIFSIGILLSLIALTGCMGAASQSSSFLRIFVISTSTMASIFLAAGSVIFIMRGDLIQYLIQQWPSYRFVLPALFTGRYDVEYYALFVEKNLNLFGFGCIAFFAYLLLGSTAGSWLRGQLLDGIDAMKKAKEMSKRRITGVQSKAIEHVKHLLESTSKSETKFTVDIGTKRKMRVSIAKEVSKQKRTSTEAQVQKILERQWKQVYNDSGDRMKKIMRCGCCCVSMLLCLFTTAGIAFLVFASFCSTLELLEASVERNDTLSSGSNESAPTILEWENMYPRGSLIVRVSASYPESSFWAHTSIASKALDKSMRKAFVDSNVTGSRLQIGITGHAAEEVLSTDFACQSASIEAVVARGPSSMLRPRVRLNSKAADASFIGYEGRSENSFTTYPHCTLPHRLALPTCGMCG